MSAALKDQHYGQLRDGSGITDEVMAERRYRSVTAAETGQYGFSSAQRLDGLLLPVHCTDGTNGLYVLRPDRPRQMRDGKVLKYEVPRGANIRIDCPPRCRPMLADPKVPLWITEGQKKADALASHHCCAIDLLGVFGYMGKNQFGGVTFLVDFDHIALNGREVRILFDSDVMVKAEVRMALDKLSTHLQRKGAHVTAVYLPQENGQKIGADDYLLTHTIADLEGLVEAPRLEVKAAAPIVELLDEAPPAMGRPLSLIEGRAYAAVWLWTKTTRTETYDEKRKEIVRHDPPIELRRRELLIVRDDGEVFGPGMLQGFDALGLDVRLPEAPRVAKLWRTAGVKNFKSGYRPDPVDVFHRVRDVIQSFMSFDRSIADQETMCALVACYILATWFLDAFSTIGYLWPNGGWGTGKTKLGMLVCDMSYLGEVLLSGSTYATLRDLADMGATLLFDDVDAMFDPKQKQDPDKRNLLLAGNRRGAYITVKEPSADGTWKTRYVNAFCPRLFTAIRVPDAVLDSRTILIPLVRTADKKKANADVLDYAQWPFDRYQLLDDVWAVALANLAQMPAHEAAVNEDAPLTGRLLEPWRPVLAVAHWLDEAGEAELYERMIKLSQSYQTERTEIGVVDVTRLVVRALVDVVTSVASMTSVTSEKWDLPIEFDASHVAARVNEITIDEELADGNGPEYTNAKRVGKVLSTLRIRRAQRAARNRPRQITLSELNDVCASYGVRLPLSMTSDHPLGETSQTSQTTQTSRTDDPDLRQDEREVLES